MLTDIKNILKQEKFLKIIIAVQIGLYALIMLFLYCHTEALFPDEESFFYFPYCFSLNRFTDLFRIENHLGYGSFYWILIKIVRNILLLRIIYWFLLIMVPIIIIYIQRKIQNISYEVIILSNFIFLSSPAMWFVTKIIGPEILSNTIGILGCFILLWLFAKYETQILCNQQNNFKQFILYFCGCCLLGLSIGIKPYNIVYTVFIFIYIALLYFPFNKFFFKIITIATIGEIFGFILSNLFILKHIGLYKSNIMLISNFKDDLEIPAIIFGKKYICWDSVLTGGINTYIISVFCLLIIILLGICYSKNKKIVVSAVIAILLLILSFSKANFWGWYLISIVFFALLCLPQRMNIILIIAVIINFFIMLPNVDAQLSSKFLQINISRNTTEIVNMVNEYNNTYKDYKPIYFISPTITNKKLRYSVEDSRIETDKIKEKTIFYISDFARKFNNINDIILQTGKSNKYVLIEYKNGITVILYQP